MDPILPLAELAKKLSVDRGESSVFIVEMRHDDGEDINVHVAASLNVSKQPTSTVVQALAVALSASLERYCPGHMKSSDDSRPEPQAPHIPLIPPGHVALKYSDKLLLKAYKIVMKMHEQAGQRLATMLVFAAYVIDMHSRMARVDPDETLGLVRNMVEKLRADMPPKRSELPHVEA